LKNPRIISNFDFDMDLDGYYEPEVQDKLYNSRINSHNANIYPVDEFVFPCMGETGELISGLIAAERIIKKEVKND
jgi:hypothetical protein